MRGWVAAAFAIALHALLLLVARPPAPANPSTDDARARARTNARHEHRILLQRVETEVSAGRVTFGEALIRLGWLERAIEEDDTSSSERDHALALYRTMLGEVRDAVARGEPVQRAVLDATEREGRAARYKRMYPRLADALVHGGGNCVALSTLAVALTVDAGQANAAAIRVFSNHAAPDVDGFRFGMTARCHGPGIRVPAGELLARYIAARTAGDREPFTFPKSSDVCDDPGDVFGGMQLKASDPEPPTTGTLVRTTSDADCRRRTVLDEYDGDVELLDERGGSRGGVGVPTLASLDLEGRAAAAACFERRVDALAPTADAEEIVFALGDVAFAEEEAARVFALANEVDVAREYERRLTTHRRRAAAPIAELLARLDAPPHDTSSLVAGAGRLVALGDGGRTVMRRASEKHRGFWELANLMTRPASQADAIARWRTKPVDVELDVIDALPCHAETFLAQLDSLASNDARLLRAACEARVRAETAACSTVPSAETELAEAVIVRRLSIRCRNDRAFVASATQWARAKPEALASAATRRLRTE